MRYQRGSEELPEPTVSVTVALDHELAERAGTVVVAGRYTEPTCSVVVCADDLPVAKSVALRAFAEALPSLSDLEATELAAAATQRASESESGTRVPSGPEETN